MVNEIIKLDCETMLKDYKSIEEKMTDATSIYQKTIDDLDREFEEYKISDKDRLQLKINFRVNLTLTFSAKAVETALQLQQVRSQVSLSEAEIAFNQARTELVQAQTDTEREKKNLVTREIQAHDDNLRVQEATQLSNMVFGYASGGVNIPTDLSAKAFNAVDRITP